MMTALLKLFTRQPQPLTLTTRQIEQLEMLTPETLLYSADGELIDQSRQTIEEFVEQHKDNWTVNQILDGEL